MRIKKNEKERKIRKFTRMISQINFLYLKKQKIM